MERIRRLGYIYCWCIVRGSRGNGVASSPSKCASYRAPGRHLIKTTQKGAPTDAATGGTESAKMMHQPDIPTLHYLIEE
jgi:hypothetical protein